MPARKLLLTLIKLSAMIGSGISQQEHRRGWDRNGHLPEQEGLSLFGARLGRYSIF
jgi:hypothetical protein